ncbi:MAG: hypothetical protein Q7R95_01195 [bacterium]|nr:hypothetical protein [bacterium]
MYPTESRYYSPSVLQNPINSLELAVYSALGSEFYLQGLHLLPNTGFSVRKQVGQLEKDLQQSPIQSSIETFTQWQNKTKEDIKGFYSEYIAQYSLLPFSLEVQNLNGKNKITAPNYENKVVLKTIDPYERKGASYESFQELEQFLILAEPGSIVVRTSPPGWTGFNYKFKETQTQIFVKEFDGIKAFSLRTNMKLDQNRLLLERFGAKLHTATSDDEIDQITDITRTNVFLKGPNEHSVSEIIQIIQECSGDLDVKNHSFNLEIFKELENSNQLIQTQKATQTFIEKFQQYSSSLIYENLPYRELMDKLELALGITIINIMKANQYVLELQPEKIIQNHSDQYLQRESIHFDDFHYGETLKQLQKLVGCNGGGNKLFEDSITEIMNSALGPRNISVKDLAKKSDKVSLECPFCHKKGDYDPCNANACMFCGVSAKDIRSKLSANNFSLN